MRSTTAAMRAISRSRADCAEAVPAAGTPAAPTAIRARAARRRERRHMSGPAYSPSPRPAHHQGPLHEAVNGADVAVGAGPAGGDDAERAAGGGAGAERRPAADQRDRRRRVKQTIGVAEEHARPR